ncbi:hypothetical protein V8C43DRAFT_89407 [Trichoderma afarasin]
MQGTRCHRIDPILPIHVNAVQDAHTHYRCHCPALSGQTHSHPSAPLLPIRLAFSLSSPLRGLLHIHPPPNFLSFFPSSEARHRAVQTPTQERNSRPKSAHHQKKNPHAREREGGKGTQLGNRPAASPLLSAQLSFLRLIFFFHF